jgi:hypothetical protein
MRQRTIRVAVGLCSLIVVATSSSSMRQSWRASLWQNHGYPRAHLAIDLGGRQRNPRLAYLAKA